MESTFPPTLQMGKLRHRASKIPPWPPAKIKPRHSDSRAGHSAPPPFGLHESLTLVGCLSGLTREGKCLPKITQQTRDRVGDSVSLSSKLRTSHTPRVYWSGRWGRGVKFHPWEVPLTILSLACLHTHNLALNQPESVNDGAGGGRLEGEGVGPQAIITFTAVNCGGVKNRTPVMDFKTQQQGFPDASFG